MVEIEEKFVVPRRGQPKHTSPSYMYWCNPGKESSFTEAVCFCVFLMLWTMASISAWVPSGLDFGLWAQWAGIVPPRLKRHWQRASDPRTARFTEIKAGFWPCYGMLDFLFFPYPWLILRQWKVRKPSKHLSIQAHLSIWAVLSDYILLKEIA